MIYYTIHKSTAVLNACDSHMRLNKKTMMGPLCLCQQQIFLLPDVAVSFSHYFAKLTHCCSGKSAILLTNKEEK